MITKEKKIYLLSKENVGKALLKLGIPTMIGMMTSALYNLLDSYFVSGLGTSQMGAVSVMFPLSMIFLGIGLLFGVGSGSSLSRLLGKKENKKADEYASTAVFFSILISIIIATGLLALLNPVLTFLGTSSTMMSYAVSYAVPFIIGLMFNVFNATINNIAASEGATALSMTGMLSGGIVNIILDPIFIYVFNWGVSGAAWATLVSRLVTTSIYLHYIFSKKSNFNFSLRNIKPTNDFFANVMKIGLTMLINQFLSAFALTLTNKFAVTYGDSAIASFGIVQKIFALFSMMIFGFVKGLQPIVGFCYGAKDFNREKKATRTCIAWMTAFNFLFVLVLILFRTSIMNAFSTDSSVIETGNMIIIVQGLSFLTFSFQAVENSCFMAKGKAKEAGLLSLGRQGFFYIPLICIFSRYIGLNGIIWSQAIADYLSFLLVIALLIKDKKKACL